jgi:hypothetical protein
MSIVLVIPSLPAPPVFQGEPHPKALHKTVGKIALANPAILTLLERGVRDSISATPFFVRTSARGEVSAGDCWAYRGPAINTTRRDLLSQIETALVSAGWVKNGPTELDPRLYFTGRAA